MKLCFVHEGWLHIFHGLDVLLFVRIYTYVLCAIGAGGNGDDKDT